MNNTIKVRNHHFTIGTKTIRKNGRTYLYYCVKLNLGKDPVTGNQKQKTITAKTKEDLVLSLERELGVPVFPPEASISLSEWLHTWLHTYGERCYKRSTITGYRYRIDTVIIPELGNIAIKDLDECIISGFYDKLEKRGCSIGYVLDIHHILQQALKYAVCKRYLIYNPCDTVPLKKRPYVKPTIFTPEECAAFKELIRNDPYRDILGVLIGTGLRIGEAIGLSWDCVDFDSRSIFVCNQITDIKGDQGKGIIHLWQNSTKNGSAHRIFFSDDTAEYLLHQKEHQEKDRLKYGAAWKNEHNLVFTMADGSPMNASTLRHHFNDIVTLLGRTDLHVHSLRHTAASAAWDKSHNLRAIQDMLGHNSPRTTEHYTQSLEQALRDQARDVEAYWNSALLPDICSAASNS